MRKFSFLLAAAISIAASTALAQKATEQYIPLGRSPGLSNQQTDIANIVSIDGDQRVVTIEMDGGEKQVRITDETRIWLDRTRYGRSNRAAGLKDLAQGQRVEIHYVDKTQQPPLAAWIKAVPRSEP